MREQKRRERYRIKRKDAKEERGCREISRKKDEDKTSELEGEEKRGQRNE